MKKDLTSLLDTQFNMRVKVKGVDESKSRSLSTMSSTTIKMDKNSFIQIIELLEEIQHNSDSILSLGLDLTAFEAPIYEVIEMLLSKVLSPNQLGLVHLYLFGDTYIENVQIPTNKEGEGIEVDTPEDLWKVINKKQ